MKYFYWAALFFILAYLVPITGRPLLRPDEFRYGEIPREMLQSGDFVVPRVMQIRYFEKPVMGYWLTAASFKIFGENKFALRLPMALSIGFTALLLGLWVKREKRDPELALFSAMMFLASGLAIALGTTAVLDAILALFTTATIICACSAVRAGRWSFERVVWLVLCGVTAGLGFLTKGLVAWVVPGLAVAAWLIWEKRFTVFLWMPWIPLAAAAATIGPWAWLVHRGDADFWHYFIWVEHFQRFNEEVRSQHPEPFWYFVPVLAGAIFPAALTAFPGFVAGKTQWLKPLKDSFGRLCVCGVVLPFLFFSASTGKLATYILPCFPFVAVLLAEPALAALRRGQGEKTLRLTLDIFGWLILVAGAGATALGAALLPPVRLSRLVPALDTAWPFFLAVGVAGVVVGIVICRCRENSMRRIGVFFGALALLGATVALLPDFSSHKMPGADIEFLKNSAAAGSMKFIPFSYGPMGQAVAWTLNRSDTRLLLSVGEMEYGEKRAREAGEPPLVFSREEFAALLARPDRPAVIYFTRAGRDIPKPFNAYPHLREKHRSMEMLIFPPPPAK